MCYTSHVKQVVDSTDLYFEEKNLICTKIFTKYILILNYTKYIRSYTVKLLS